MKPTSSSSLTSTSQLGSGQEHPTNIEGELSTGQLLQNVSFINQVAQKVAENLTQNQLGFGSKFASINPNWKFYERAEPTVVTDGRPNTVPPLNFSVPLHETDLNDTFDEASLLKKVPKRFKDKAIQLLKKFDERPNELTWDSSGNIYINEQVIPNSNIFKFFPFLFKKSYPKYLTGFSDFTNQIGTMGLSHLLHPVTKTKLSSNPVPQLSKKETSTSISTINNWWYIGE